MPDQLPLSIPNEGKADSGPPLPAFSENYRVPMDDKENNDIICPTCKRGPVESDEDAIKAVLALADRSLTRKQYVTRALALATFIFLQWNLFFLGDRTLWDGWWAAGTVVALLGFADFLKYRVRRDNDLPGDYEYGIP